MNVPLEAPAPPPRRRRWIGVLAIIALVALGVWHLPPNQAIDRPVTLERDAAGQLQETSTAAPTSGPTFSAVAGALQASNQTTSVSSTSSSDPGWFLSGRLTILNDSDHPLLQRVGAALVTELRKPEFSKTGVERVEYLPVGERLPRGGLAPNPFVTLELESAEHSGLLGRELQAVVLMTVGTSWRASNHSVSGTGTPPFLVFRSETRVQHRSTLTGVESPSARYTLQGKNIAEALAGRLTKELADLREKHPAPPALPAEMLAEFREPPALNFLADLQAEEVVSLHRTMVHNETFWRLPEPADLAAALGQVRQELEQAGWRVGDVNMEPQSAHLRGSQAGRTIELFREGIGSSLGASTEDGKLSPLIVRHEELMSPADNQAWFETLLTADRPDVDLLVQMRHYGSPEQVARVIELLQTHPPQSVDGWLALAEHFDRSDPAQAESALRRAYAWSVLTNDDDRRSKIDSLARRLKVDPKSLRKIPAELWAACGILPLDATTPVREFELRAGERAAVYVTEGDGWTVHGAEVTALGGRQHRLTAYRLSDDAGRSSSMRSHDISGNASHPRNADLPLVSSVSNLKDGRHVTVSIGTAGPESYRVSIRREEKSAAPGNAAAEQQ